MTTTISVSFVDRYSTHGLWAGGAIAGNHYLHRMPDPRTSYEIAIINLSRYPEPVGALIFNRPEATRCYPWYGGVDDVQSGRSEVTRWQVLNLARVYIQPRFQRGGAYFIPGIVPGFFDRHGMFRSTLGSEAIQCALQRIGYDYLLRRPPVFLDEPYEIRWLLSYCDTRLHRGALYRSSGFERFRINANGIETWRIPLPALTAEQHQAIRQASQGDQRARKLQNRRLSAQQLTIAF
jgi:hypothetical protein